MITLLIHDVLTASVTQGEWSVPQGWDNLAEALSLNNPLNTPDLPDFDWACAQAAVDYLGPDNAKILSPQPKPQAKAGRIY